MEAQHVASTLPLVDSLEEQRILEDILEATKPPAPAAARGLHYLLFTPFRYTPLHASRFRGLAHPPVFYGAEAIRTACAELGYWRWRFLEDSAGLRQLGPAPQTLFESRARALTVDLQARPFSRDERKWTDPVDYGATQQFAVSARAAKIGMILYKSVRDDEPGRCGAILTPSAFEPRHPVSPTQTWILTVKPDFAYWQRDRESFAFDMRRWRLIPGKSG